MKWLIYPISILIFFGLAIIQNSFLVYFSIMGVTINLVFILFFIIIFFLDEREYNTGFWVSVIAGLFLDLFLPFYFGLSIISLVIIYFLEKALFNFLKEGPDKFTVFYFTPFFLIFFSIYSTFLYLLSLIFNFDINIGLDLSFLVAIVYNGILAVVGFYLFKNFVRKQKDDNQLKLL